MRVRLLFSESFRSLGANLSTTIAATMTVLIGMFLLGLFIAPAPSMAAASSPWAIQMTVSTTTPHPAAAAVRSGARPVLQATTWSNSVSSAARL